MSISSFLLPLLLPVLNSEAVPALGDSDLGLAEFQSALHLLHKEDENNLLAISKILFSTMDSK